VERIWYIFNNPLKYKQANPLILSGDSSMSSSATALREAVEFEKKALEKYTEAAALVKHPETKASIEKITAEKKQAIESMHWIIMAEAGEIETEKPAPAVEGEEPKSGASKCPFSGALAEMGIDITKMSKEEAMEKMGDMSKIFPEGSDS
jgi:rubrerythrin